MSNLLTAFPILTSARLVIVSIFRQRHAALEMTAGAITS